MEKVNSQRLTYFLRFHIIIVKNLVAKGGATMATSSIFTQVKISDPKKAERFVEALESSEQTRKKPSAPTIPILSDKKAIREWMAKRGSKQ